MEDKAFGRLKKPLEDYSPHGRQQSLENNTIFFFLKIIKSVQTKFPLRKTQLPGTREMGVIAGAHENCHAERLNNNLGPASNSPRPQQGFKHS